MFGPKAAKSLSTTLGAFGCSQQTALQSQVKDVTVQSQITQCIGCMFVHFCTEEDLSSLRVKIQAEVKNLRGQGLQEAKVLPPLLLSKVNATLAMQK